MPSLELDEFLPDSGGVGTKADLDWLLEENPGLKAGSFSQLPIGDRQNCAEIVRGIANSGQLISVYGTVNPYSDIARLGEMFVSNGGKLPPNLDDFFEQRNGYVPVSYGAGVQGAVITEDDGSQVRIKAVESAPENPCVVLLYAGNGNGLEKAVRKPEARQPRLF